MVHIPAYAEDFLKSLIRSAYTDPWGSMTHVRKTAWAELLLDCPDCKARRGEECRVLKGQNHHAHVGRHRQAREWYTEWRDRIVNEEVRTICPWCGYWFRSEAEELAHEETCDA